MTQVYIAGIRLPPSHDEEAVISAAASLLGVHPGHIREARIARRSIDARRKSAVVLVYALEASVDEGVLPERAALRFNPPPVESWKRPVPGKEPLPFQPLVVGSGPAGLFAALLLAEAGYAPLVLERGRAVAERIMDVDRFVKRGELDPESNIQFGEGGAGTFSDGKLATQIRDPRCRFVLETLAAAGAPADILVSARPHVGTDNLRRVVAGLRSRITSAGGEVRFGSRVSDIRTEAGAAAAVEVNGAARIRTGCVILAAGHSARDVYEFLWQRGCAMAAKPFSMGIRIEHLQEMVDKSQYGDFAGHPRLGPAEYKLAYHGPEGRSAYTFCMCPGGWVIAAASERDGVVTNGMSLFARDGRNANSALLVNVNPADFGSDHPLAGIAFQRRWEKAAYEAGGGGFIAPAQTAADFLKGRPSSALGAVEPSYRPGWRLTDLSQSLPPFVADALRRALPAMDRKLRGFGNPEAVLTGIESRSSSPVRIIRDAEGMSSIRGLYPAGEGAGMAGGIVSAAVDGMRAAEAVIRRYAPPS